MGDGIYTAVAGACAQAERIDSIANNLANLMTVGFKADRPVFAEVLRAGLDQAYVAPRGAAPDLSPGPLKRTGNPLDLAVEGPGFFVVATPAGERLTRAGAFGRDGEGRLVTPAGQQVLGHDGAIHLGDGAVEVSGDGTVTAGGREVGRLRLLEPGPEAVLIKEGRNLFALEGPDQALKPARGKISQGFVELSNARPTESLVRLITAQRTFEVLLNAMRNFQQMDSQLAREAKLGG